MNIELVFNLHVIGLSEWEVRVQRKVIVPCAMKGETIFHGIHRELKDISVVGCISSGSDHMTPFLVSSHVNRSVVRTNKSTVQNRK
jgi:hypothetical protein